MKVRTKLIIGATVVIVLLWLVVFHAVNNINDLKEHFTAVEDEVIPDTIEIAKIGTAAGEAYHQTMNYALYDDASASADARTQIHALEQMADQYLPQAEDISPEEYTNNQLLLTKIYTLTVNLTGMLNLKETGTDVSELLIIDRETTLPALLDLEIYIDERRAAGIAQLTTISEDYAQASSSGIRTLLIIVGVMTLLGLGIAHYLSWSIVRPLHALHKGTEIIAQGNLDYKVGTRAKDEIGQLSRSFDEMTASLNKSMTSIDVLNQEIAERKRAEAELQKSEKKFSVAFYSSPNSMCISRVEDGVFIDVNDSFTRDNGYTREEVIGHSSVELNIWVNPEDRKRIMGKLKKDGRVREEEYLARHKTGEIRTMLFSAGPVNIEGQECMIAVSSDITERKQAEKALKESQEFSNSLLENAPTQIIVFNPDTSIRYVNPKFEEVNGWTAAEVIGTKAPYPWWPDEMRTEEAVATFKEFLNMDQGQSEYPSIKKNGELRWLDLNWTAVKRDGNLQYCLANSLDITERKKMEETIRIREERFSDIAENALEWIWEIDAKGKYTYSSPVVEKILGYKPEEILEKHFYDLFYPKDRAKLKKAAFQAFARKQPLRDFINWNVHKNGSLVCLSTSIMPVLDAAGNLLGYRGVDTDITERYKAEQLQHDENYVLTLLGQGAALGEILDAIIRLGEKLDPTIRGSILLYDPESERLFPGASPNIPAGYLKMIKEGISIGEKAGSCGTAAFTKKQVIVPDITKSPLYQPYPEAIEVSVKNKILASWSQPILASNGELLGTIANYRQEVGKPDADNIRMLEWSARIAGIAIERRQAEKALQESEEKFFKAFRSSPNTIAITTLKDGKFLEVNDSFTDITGYAREEAIGHTVKDINIWANPTDRNKMLRILKKDGRVHNHEFDFRIKSGEIRTWLFSAELIDINNEPCMISMTIDITERKQGEEALANEATWRRILIEESRDGIVILDQDAKVYEANQRFAEMLGYSPEEVMELHTWDWDTQWSREELLEMGQNVDENGLHLETYHQRKDGTTFDVDISVNGAWFGNKKLIFCVCRDITERKRAEQAIKESEEKFSKAFHTSPEAISISRLDDTIFVEVNDSLLRITGYTREELIGHSAAEYGMWANPKQQKAIARKINKRERLQNEEFELRTKSGEIRIMLYSCEYLTLNGKECMLVSSTDITERKQMQEALRESEEKFNRAFHASPIISAIVSERDHKYIEVNKNFLDFYGLTRPEVIGHSASDIGLWKNNTERDKITGKLHQQGHIQDEEIHMRTKSGRNLTGLFSAEKVIFGGEPCFVSMIVDITARKEAEEALRINEERFRLIADNATDLISRIQLVPEVKTDYVSPSCRRITGYRQEEFYQDPNLGLNMIHPEDRDFFYKYVTPTVQKDQKPITVRLIRKDGKVIWIEQTHSAITDEKGRPIAMHLISRDITERKSSEAQLKEALANLEQSSAQLAATNKELETFSYSVSHDLRSPLRSIDGFSQALLEDYRGKLDETGQDYLNRLRNASQKMGELIDGILKLSRLTRGEMHQEKVDLSALAMEISSRLQENDPQRKADFIIKDGLTARGDPQLLRALLENLLGNAWKFTGKRDKARIELGTTKNGKKTTYFINDNGAGFDMEYADKLFGAFQRLHDTTEYPGTGIGLATVQRIVNRHGGSIWAKGAVDKGATFYFTLN